MLWVLVQNTARRVQRHPGFFRALFQRTLAVAGHLYRLALVAADEYSGLKLAEFLRNRNHTGIEGDLDEACSFGLRTVQSALVHRVVLEQDPAYGFPTYAVESLARMLVLHLGVVLQTQR